MCGIIGVVGNRDIKNIVVDALDLMEYRGYDSAGISFLDDNKIVNFKSLISSSDLRNNFDDKNYNIGIGHTRWATHGEVNLINCHPHDYEEFSLVHNGIIENFECIKKQILNLGYTIKSSTDSEIALLYFVSVFKKYNDIKTALQKTINHLEGNFAILIMYDNKIYFMRKGITALAFTNKDELNIISSDSIVLSQFHDKCIYLDQDMFGVINNNIEMFDIDGYIIEPKYTIIEHIDFSSKNVMQVDSYLYKEIYEQPYTSQKTIDYLMNYNWDKIQEYINDINHIYIIGCGSSYHVGMVAEYWIREFTNLTISVEIASEFKYKKLPESDKVLAIFISQSGETADTLAALVYAKSLKYKTISTSNIPNSSIARLSDFNICNNAGVEISVASTKVFTSQLITMLFISIHINNFSDKDLYIEKIKTIPSNISNILNSNIQYQELITLFNNAKNIIFTSRGILYPLSLEGSLKFKELSYIQSIGISSGEFKHGTLSLIDEESLTIFIANDNNMFNKIYSNIQEIVARKGKVIILCNNSKYNKLSQLTPYIIEIPNIDDILQPIINVIPLQLIAYHFAKHKGYNLDKPRNLAKSVTVE